MINEPIDITPILTDGWNEIRRCIGVGKSRYSRAIGKWQAAIWVHTTHIVYSVKGFATEAEADAEAQRKFEEIKKRIK